MLGAVIRNGNNTLVVDLPTGMMDLQTKLSSIGIDRTAENINLSDEDGDRIRVKLYATEPEEAHLLCLLTPDRTLADANSSMMLLQRANQNSLPRLKCCLLGDNYRSLEDFINDAKQVFTRERAVDRCTQAMQRFEEDPNMTDRNTMLKTITRRLFRGKCSTGYKRNSPDVPAREKSNRSARKQNPARIPASTP